MPGEKFLPGLTRSDSERFCAGAAAVRHNSPAIQGDIAMFDSLDDEIEKAEAGDSDDTSRVTRYMIVVLVSAVVFSGLVLSIWFLG